MGLLRECYRRFQVLRHAPRHWRLRPNTIDRRIFRTVVIDNEYRLPDRLRGDDVILDVGAHVGCFALACLRRGAGRIVCCEPDADNFRLLQHNLAPYAERVRLRQAAVWRSDAPSTALPLHNPLDGRNTGAVRVGGDGSGAPAVAFDDLVRELGRVSLAKLDCEGAEWPILLTSTSLSRIDSIRGEFHLGAFPEAYHAGGRTGFTPELLRRTLEGHGFQAEVIEAPGSSPPVGLFFARRPLTGPAPRLG
jgi:FkbM family methyltransferase